MIKCRKREIYNYPCNTTNSIHFIRFRQMFMSFFNRLGSNYKTNILTALKAVESSIKQLNIRLSDFCKDYTMHK